MKPARAGWLHVRHQERGWGENVDLDIVVASAGQMIVKAAVANERGFVK